MRIVSWNCHEGLGTTNTKRTLFYKENAGEDSAIIILIEARPTDCIDGYEETEFNTNPEFENWIGVEYSQKGRNKGIKVFYNSNKIKSISINSEIMRELNKTEKYFVPFAITTKEGKKINVVAVWTHDRQRYGYEIISELLESKPYEINYKGFNAFIDGKDKNVIVIGDFNLRNENSGFCEVVKTLKNHGLESKYHYDKNGDYSKWEPTNKCGGESMIDYAFISEHLLENSTLEIGGGFDDGYCGSDHKPLILTIDEDDLI
jgi:hypothetical protein